MEELCKTITVKCQKTMELGKYYMQKTCQLRFSALANCKKLLPHFYIKKLKHHTTNDFLKHCIVLFKTKDLIGFHNKVICQ